MCYAHILLFHFFEMERVFFLIAAGSGFDGCATAMDFHHDSPHWQSTFSNINLFHKKSIVFFKKNRCFFRQPHFDVRTGKNRKIQSKIKKNVSRNSCSNYGKHRNIIRKNEKSRDRTENDCFLGNLMPFFCPIFLRKNRPQRKSLFNVYNRSFSASEKMIYRKVFLCIRTAMMMTSPFTVP